MSEAIALSITDWVTYITVLELLFWVGLYLKSIGSGIVIFHICLPKCKIITASDLTDFPLTDPV